MNTPYSFYRYLTFIYTGAGVLGVPHRLHCESAETNIKPKAYTTQTSNARPFGLYSKLPPGVILHGTFHISFIGYAEPTCQRLGKM